MSWHKIARAAAAAEYGRQHMDRYVRLARAGTVLGCIGIALLIFGIAIAVNGGFGG